MQFRLPIFIAFACMASMLRAASAEAPAVTPQSLRALVVENPDSVLSILDELDTAGAESLPAFQSNLLRGLAYNEKRMFSLVERYARQTLASDSIDSHLKEKLNALTLLSVAQSFFGDYQGSIQSSTEAMGIARQTENLAARFNILTTMAKTSFAMGNRKQGYDYLEQIITEGGESQDARVLANVSAAQGVKIVELYADDRFDEGLAEGHRRLALIERIDATGGSPAGFCDQQRAYAYARIASCAQRAGKPQEAGEAFNAFMATDYAGNPVGRAYIMDYLLDSGQWKRVLDFTAPLYPMFEQSDTVNTDFLSLLTSDARAQAGLGNHARAYALLQRATAIQDSLYLREKNSRAQELASVFALNEKELELVNAKATLHRRHILLMAAIVTGALALIIVLLMYRAYRRELELRKTAAKRIDELLAMHHINPDASDTDKENFALFNRMQQTIVDGALFKQPAFNRDGIVEASGLPRAKVVLLIEKFAGMTPNDYINKLRVEHSVELIRQHPDWTIDAIAEECGYVRRATYYRHFNRIFGITPAQYRKERLKSPLPSAPNE